MNSFQFITAPTIPEASELLTTNAASTRIIAGGTDLLGEIKERVVTPARLVSLQAIDRLRGISIDEDGAKIGAMTTIAEIAAHPHTYMRTRYAALAQACDSVATPQIRNVGTIGGNLCQRPRCWYYRSPHFDCRKKGGDRCFAHDGMNKFHAIFDAEICPAVHPSDTAVALAALDATVALSSSQGARAMPIDDFFVAPAVDVAAENVLRPGEILAEIAIPPHTANTRSIYLKAKERQAMDFALASVALAIEIEEDQVTGARIALGGVAPVPYRAQDAEQAILGKPIAELDTDLIGRAAVADAAPLSGNRYKVQLASALVSRAIRTLLPDDAWRPSL